MKKTIIAILALSGVALATTGEDLNASIAQDLTGYTAGDAFTITTQLGSIGNQNKGFVTIAPDYYVVNQSHSYWGLNTKDSNNLTTDTTSFELTVDGNNYTYTSPEKTQIVTWTRDAGNTGSATRTVGNHINVDIACDGTDSTITLGYTGTDIKDIFVLKGTVLDATKISFADNIADVQAYSVTFTPSVPEPATATLSLLALAGLASRRRRH